nr:hypothetical protein [uncultured Oscillibacter sp.]
MARNRVKGITVEIGGDTKKFNKAIEGLNKDLSKTSRSLKAVNDQLKLDPSNVELLASKERLLAQQLEKTEERYKFLRKAQEDANVDDAKYEEWEKALSSIQGQITKTVNEISKLNKEAKKLETSKSEDGGGKLAAILAEIAEKQKGVEALQQSITDTYDAMNRPISTEMWDDLVLKTSKAGIAFQNAKDESEDFRKSYVKNVDSMSDLAIAIEEASGATDDMADAWDETSKGADNAAGSFGEATDSAEESQKAFDNFSPTASRFASAADTISDKAGKIASATKRVSLAAGGLLTGMLGSVKGTEEFRTNLSKLETNANLAGVSMEFIDGALKELNRVSSDSDSNIETLSNLLQSGADESTLQQAVEALAGTVEQFPQTLTLESLADGLQETLATGEATGQFAEALDRLGIGAEKFSKQLSQVPGEADKLHFALDTLTNQGLADVHRAWVEEHGDLVENKDATYEFQQSLAELGEEMQPLMATVTELASSFLNWFNGLSDGKQNAIVALIALVAAISPVAGAISAVSGAIGMVNQNLGSVKTAASSVFTFFTTNPMLAAVLAIAGAVALIALNWDTVKEAAKKAVDAIVGFLEKGINAVKKFFGVLDDGDSSGGKGRGGKGRGGFADAGTPSLRQSGVPLATATASLDNYPHFASGGVFAPNNPMLGVLGDHKTEYEVAAPESVIESSVQKALLTSGLGGGQKTVVDVHFSGTLAPLIRQLHPLITAETTRLGPAMAPRR